MKLTVVDLPLTHPSRNKIGLAKSRTDQPTDGQHLRIKSPCRRLKRSIFNVLICCIFQISLDNSVIHKLHKLQRGVILANVFDKNSLNDLPTQWTACFFLQPNTNTTHMKNM